MNRRAFLRSLAGVPAAAFVVLTGRRLGMSRVETVGPFGLQALVDDGTTSGRYLGIPRRQIYARIAISQEVIAASVQGGAFAAARRAETAALIADIERSFVPRRRWSWRWLRRQ